MSSVVKGVFGGGSSASSAGKAQARAAEAGVREQRRQFDVTQQNLAPFLEAGRGALGSELALLGLSGQGAQQQALDDFSLRPDQQFIQQQGEQALLRNQAAIGGLGGGNVQRELQSFGQGTASQALSEQLNRLASLRGGGQTATTNLGQLGQTSATNISNLLGQAGSAKASGILGQQQADAGLANQALGIGSLLLGGGLFSDMRIKENITKVGQLPSGINWYVWDWKEEFIGLVNGQPGEGVIAQEVQLEIPDAVTKAGDYLTVDYMKVH